MPRIFDNLAQETRLVGVLRETMAGTTREYRSISRIFSGSPR